MSSKKTFLIMLIMLILITMGGAWASDEHAVDEVSAADDDAIAVDSVDDTQKDTSEIQENLTIQKTEETAQAADSDSNENGEILGATSDEDVLGAPWTTDQTISSTITISDSNTLIDGGGHSITMTGNKIIYSLNNNLNDITFQNIKFINGKNNQGKGGAVYVGTGCSNIQFKNCIFERNSAQMGGAVYVGNGVASSTYVNNISFINCKFNGNTATGTATSGSQVSGGGALNIYRTKNVLIKNCTFDGNNATVNGGACLFEWCDKGTELNIVDCTFKNNNGAMGAAIKYSYANFNLNVNPATCGVD